MRPAHAMIQVRDLSRAASFYERALGFAEVDRHAYEGATLVYLRGRECPFEIELIAPHCWPFAERPESGRTHLAFTVDDLEAERARLLRLGIAPDPIADHVANGAHQTRYFYFYDPEGNGIEFLEAKGRYGTQKEEPC